MGNITLWVISSDISQLQPDNIQSRDPCRPTARDQKQLMDHVSQLLRAFSIDFFYRRSVYITKYTVIWKYCQNILKGLIFINVSAINSLIFICCGNSRSLIIFSSFNISSCLIKFLSFFVFLLSSLADHVVYTISVFFNFQF